MIKIQTIFVFGILSFESEPGYFWHEKKTGHRSQTNRKNVLYQLIKILIFNIFWLFVGNKYGTFLSSGRIRIRCFLSFFFFYSVAGSNESGTGPKPHLMYHPELHEFSGLIFYLQRNLWTYTSQLSGLWQSSKRRHPTILMLYSEFLIFWCRCSIAV